MINMENILCLGLLSVIIYLLYFYNPNKEQNEFDENKNLIIDKYEENEYIPINITYDQMAKIYLQDYVYKLIYKREEAYNLLDENYRNKKFTSFEHFNTYIDNIMSIRLKEMNVKKYAITEQNEFRYFDIYDSGDNLFIIKENGVMQYTVFFDRYTTNLE